MEILKICHVAQHNGGDTFAVGWRLGEVSLLQASELSEESVPEAMVAEARERPGEWVYANLPAELEAMLGRARAIVIMVNASSPTRRPRSAIKGDAKAKARADLDAWLFLSALAIDIADIFGRLQKAVRAS
jgi:hypothetical protein